MASFTGTKIYGLYRIEDELEGNGVYYLTPRGNNFFATDIFQASSDEEARKISEEKYGQTYLYSQITERIREYGFFCRNSSKDRHEYDYLTPEGNTVRVTHIIESPTEEGAKTIAASFEESTNLEYRGEVTKLLQVHKISMTETNDTDVMEEILNEDHDK